MTAMDRTAYPRPGERLTREELQTRYDLSEADHAFLRAAARGEAGRLTLATILKTRLDLGVFLALAEVDAGIVTHLARQLGLTAPPPLLPEDSGKSTLYRYRAAVRAHLGVASYPDAGEVLVTNSVLEAAETMSDPADLINRAIEALRDARIDLPAFSTLDRLVNHLRGRVHERMYERVAARLSAESMAALDTLLTVPPDGATTPFTRLKQTPGPARLETIALWTDRLGWLIGLPDPGALLEGISHTKLRQFAAEAAALEPGELLDMSQRGKRHTLLHHPVQFLAYHRLTRHEGEVIQPPPSSLVKAFRMPPNGKCQMMFTDSFCHSAMALPTACVVERVTTRW